MYTKPLVAVGLVMLLVTSNSVAALSGARIADAAEKKDLAKVAPLIKQGADVNASQPDGMTALHWAAYRIGP